MYFLGYDFESLFDSSGRVFLRNVSDLILNVLMKQSYDCCDSDFDEEEIFNLGFCSKKISFWEFFSIKSILI